MTFQTRNTTYTLRDMGDGAFTIQGHARYCPSPVLVTLPYGTPAIGQRFHFCYVAPRPGKSEPDVVTTSRVVQVWS